MLTLHLPSTRSAIKVSPAAKGKPARCSAGKEYIQALQERMQREMLKHVDLNPDVSSPMTYQSPEDAQIKKAERYALDKWSSPSFHVTGVAVAFVCAILMIMNSPMSTPTM